MQERHPARRELIVTISKNERLLIMLLSTHRFFEVKKLYLVEKSAPICEWSLTSPNNRRKGGKVLNHQSGEVFERSSELSVLARTIRKSDFLRKTSMNEGRVESSLGA
jgi:hypothetical protein